MAVSACVESTYTSGGLSRFVAAIWLLSNQWFYSFIGKIHNILQQEIVPTEIQQMLLVNLTPMEN